MRAARSNLRGLLILLFAGNFLTIIDCSNSGRKRNMDVHETPSISSTKKLRNVMGATSTSGVANKAGSSSKLKNLWPKEVDQMILTTYYDNLRGNSVDWRKVSSILNDNQVHFAHSEAAYHRVHKVLQRITQTTPAYGEGNVLWTSGMKSKIIRIYYQSRSGDENEHALNMYKTWRNEHPHFPDIRPIDLLHQAENMLMKNGLLDPPSSLSKDRERKIFADESFKFSPQQENLILKIKNKISQDEPIRYDYLYDELCKEDFSFCLASPQKLAKKARYMVRNCEKRRQKSRAPDESGKETDFLNQSRKEKHHQYYEFMGVQDNPLVHSQSAYDHAQGIGVSSSHQGSTHEHPDLDLSLVPGAVGTPRFHDSDVDLDLSLSSRKKKGKSIWKRGSS